MKILSIWGPWAQLIAIGCKDVENRSWSTDYRGPVAIHCTKGNWELGEAAEILDDCVARGMISAEQADTIKARLEDDRGKVIAVVDLTGCQESTKSESPWASKEAGGYVFELANARLVEPIEVRGQQGLRDLDEEIAEQLREPGEARTRGGYDLDVADLFGRAPRAENNKEAKKARRSPSSGVAIKVWSDTVLKRAEREVYRPRGQIEIGEERKPLAVRVVDAQTGEVLYDSVTIGETFDLEAEANDHGAEWLKSQIDRIERMVWLRVHRRHALPDRLDHVDAAKAKIGMQIKRLRSLDKECDDDHATLRLESREPEVDITYSGGKFTIIDAPSISEGTAGRRWWGAPEGGEAVQG